MKTETHKGQTTDKLERYSRAETHRLLKTETVTQRHVRTETLRQTLEHRP